MTMIWTNSRKWETVQSLCDVARIGNERLRRATALECLISIVKTHYEFLEPYMETIVDVTCTTIDEGDKHLAQLGLCFWKSICVVEIEKQNKNFLGFVFPPHSMLVLKNMNRIANVVLQSVSDKVIRIADEDLIPCLFEISACIQDYIVPIVRPFIESNLLKEDLDCIEAAVVVLGSVLEGPSKEQLSSLVEPPMVEMLIDLVEDDCLLERVLLTLVLILRHIPAVTNDIRGRLEDVLSRCLNTTEIAGVQYLAERALELLANSDEEIADNREIWEGGLEGDRDILERNLSLIRELLRKVPLQFHRFFARVFLQIHLALQKIDPLFLTAVRLVREISLLLGDSILPYTDMLMSSLCKALMTDNLNIRPCTYSCIGSIAQAIGEDFVRYASCVMVLLSEANQIWESIDINDRTMLYLGKQIKLSIFDAHASILQALKNSKVALDYMELIIKSIYLVTEDYQRGIGDTELRMRMNSMLIQMDAIISQKFIKEEENMEDID